MCWDMRSGPQPASHKLNSKAVLSELTQIGQPQLNNYFSAVDSKCPYNHSFIQKACLLKFQWEMPPTVDETLREVYTRVHRVLSL